MREQVVPIADQIIKEFGVDLHYKVGTMIEIRELLSQPTRSQRGNSSAGTNDLTQTTFGYSRDDAGASSCFSTSPAKSCLSTHSRHWMRWVAS